MRQCLTCCDSPPWIKVRHSADKAFEIIVDSLPKREWPNRVVLIESTQGYVEDRCPGIVTEVFEKIMESIFVGEVGDLTLNHDG